MSSVRKTDELDALATRLKAVRERKGITQAEFAEATGVSRSFLSEMESGRSKPSTQLILGVARAYPDIDRDWLLNGNGRMAYWAADDDPLPWVGAGRFGEDAKLNRLDLDALRCAMQLLEKHLTKTPGAIKPGTEMVFVALIYSIYIGARQDALRQEQWREQSNARAHEISSDWADRVMSLHNDGPATPETGAA